MFKDKKNKKAKPGGKIEESKSPVQLEKKNTKKIGKSVMSK
jgi:hypothetical protein|tara:strand:+ start:254 stop:376 length:123 start_codon:yes stop_codon:yes gene_type:complete